MDQKLLTRKVYMSVIVLGMVSFTVQTTSLPRVVTGRIAPCWLTGGTRTSLITATPTTPVTRGPTLGTTFVIQVYGNH